MSHLTVRRSLAGLAAPLLVVALTACGGSDDDGGDAGDDTSTSDTSSAEPDPTDEGGTDDGADEGADPGASGVADAPEDAATEEFCAGFLEDSPPADATADDVHAWADGLIATGTPASFDEGARAGFEAYVAVLADIEEADVQRFAESESPDEFFGEDDAASVTAFVTALGTECAAAGSSGGDTPSESPSTS